MRLQLGVALFSWMVSVALADPTHTKIGGTEPVSFVPLPVYATLPNEGATYGFMPVFLGYTDDLSSRIDSILAPSLTWNGVSHITATGRFFQYPDDFETRIFQATYATRLFREVILERYVQPVWRGTTTHTLSFQYRSDPYRRFFGIGKDTSHGDETTYTLNSVKAYGRIGYNIVDFLNINLLLGFNHFKPANTGVLGIKSTFDRFPDIEGLSGSNSIVSTIGVKLQTNAIREDTTQGASIEAVAGGALNAVSKSGAYGITKVEGKALWQELSKVSGAARAYWGYTYGAGIPYYERQSAGGSFLMRGFILDRFVDNGLWTIDLEQRITAFRVQVEGNLVDFRIDPFITLGQVYERSQEMFDLVQFTQGIGFRAFSPPNVIGRIDVARNEDEYNVYVELGYPF